MVGYLVDEEAAVLWLCPVGLKHLHHLSIVNERVLEVVVVVPCDGRSPLGAFRSCCCCCCCGAALRLLGCRVGAAGVLGLLRSAAALVADAAVLVSFVVAVVAGLGGQREGGGLRGACGKEGRRRQGGEEGGGGERHEVTR